MNRIAEQVFFCFFAIHLPPVEEGEFLLYIMLKSRTDRAERYRKSPVITNGYSMIYLMNVTIGQYSDRTFANRRPAFLFLFTKFF